MSCNRHYGISNYPACSGNGACIDDICICHNNWSGIGDLYPHTGVDCDNNLDVFRYWSLLNVILSCISITFISYCFYREIRFVILQNKPIWIFEGKHTCMGFIWLINISLFMCSTLKYRDPFHSNLGTYIPTSIFAVVGFTSVTYAVSIFHLILVKFLRGHMMFIDKNSRDRLQYAMNATSSLAVIFPTIFFVALVGIVIARAIDANDNSELYGILLLATVSIGYTYYACTILYIFETFLSELAKYLKQMKDQVVPPFQPFSPSRASASTKAKANTKATVKTIYDRFTMVNFLVTPTIIAGIPLNLSFLCWSFLRRKMTYMLIFQSSLMIIVTPVMVWSIRSFKFNNSRSMFASETSNSMKSSARQSGSAKVSIYNKSYILPLGSKRVTVNKVSTRVVPVNIAAYSLSNKEMPDSNV